MFALAPVTPQEGTEGPFHVLDTAGPVISTMVTSIQRCVSTEVCLGRFQRLLLRKSQV